MGVEKELKNPGGPRISGPVRSQFKQAGAEALDAGFEEGGALFCHPFCSSTPRKIFICFRPTQNIRSPRRLVSKHFDSSPLSVENILSMYYDYVYIYLKIT